MKLLSMELLAMIQHRPLRPSALKDAADLIEAQADALQACEEYRKARGQAKNQAYDDMIAAKARLMMVERETQRNAERAGKAVAQ